MASPIVDTDFSTGTTITSNWLNGVNDAINDATQDITGATPRTITSKLSETVSVKDFGAIGDGITNDTVALTNARASANELAYIDGTYYVTQFSQPTPPKKQYGVGDVTIEWHDNGTGATAWMNFPSNTIWENLNFTCADQAEWLRASVENANDVTIRNCSFNNFNNGPINDGSQNDWGLYFKNCSNITIDTCSFSNNGNTDIAIVDDVDNLTIINPSNSVQGKVSLNIEPNSRGALTRGITGMNVIGGKFNKVLLQEIENFVYANTAIVFNGSTIDTIYYDGAGVRFTNCNIQTLTNAPDGIGDVYAGNLVVDNAFLRNNMIDDPYLFSTNSAGTAYWSTYSTGGTYGRVNDQWGKYFRFNDGAANVEQSLSTTNNIPVFAGENLIFFIRSRVQSAAGTTHVHNAVIRWYNSSGTVISDTKIKCARHGLGASTDWHNDVAILVPPPEATQMKIYVGLNTGGPSVVDVASVGCFRFTLESTQTGNGVTYGNWESMLAPLANTVNEKNWYLPTYPTGAATARYFVNERVINSVPTIGQPKSWVCTVAGAPGTWVSEGNL